MNNIDWSKFKNRDDLSEAMIERMKEGYVKLCQSLQKINATLLTDYEGDSGTYTTMKIDSIEYTVGTRNFKNSICNNIHKFKEKLTENGDCFLEFIGVDEKNVLMAKIKLPLGATKEISINSYNSFIKSRNEVLDKLKELNGSLVTDYIGTKRNMIVLIDGVEFNVSGENFKEFYKNLLKFKDRIVCDGYEFVKLVESESEIKNLARAKIKSKYGEELDININNYTQFINSKKDLINKLNDVNGKILSGFVGNYDKVKVVIDEVVLDIIPNLFKTGTYKGIIKLKSDMLNNKDEFLSFTKLDNHNALVFKMKTYDGDIVEMSIGAYGKFAKAREEFNDMILKNNHKALSNYIGGEDKVLIDFNCGHPPYSISAISYKSGQGCPLCKNKGEHVLFEILNETGFNVEYQRKFDDLKVKKSLSYDFYLPDFNLLIELDGAHHFRPVPYFKKTYTKEDIDIATREAEERYIQRVEYDRIKNEYAKTNNIPLLRIDYSDGKIRRELWKDVVLEKINTI